VSITVPNNVKRGRESSLPFALPADRAPRRVTVSVIGRPVTVDCPTWCTAPHTETLVSLDDLCHEGEQTALAAPTWTAGEPRTVQILAANLAQYPFSRGTDAEPHLLLDAADDGEAAELHPARALAFADQLDAHAAQIRRLARQLPTPTGEPLVGAAARDMGSLLRATLAAEPDPQHERAGDTPDSLPPLPQRDPGKAL